MGEGKGKLETAVVENSASGIVVVGRDMRILFANRAFEKISGYTVKELLSLPPERVRSMIHPDDQERVWSRFRARLQGKDVPPKYEYRGVRKDGKVVWLEMYASTVDFEGRPAVAGVVNEITKRKKTEEELRVSRKWYMTLLESISDGVWVLDREWHYIFVNRAGARLVNMKPEDLTGRKITNVFPAVKKTEFFRMYKRSMEKRVRGTVSGPFTLPSGKGGFYEVRVYPVPDGILCIGRDVTKAKEEEEKLRMSEEKFRSVFKNLPFTAFIVDSSGRLLDANREAERVVSLKAKDFKGKRFSEFGLLEKKDLPKAFVEFRKNLAGRVTGKTIYRIKGKGGRKRLVELIGIPLKEEGRVTRVLCVGEDVTEREEAGRKIRESEEKFRILFEYAPDAIYINDLKGNFVDGNNAAEKMTGYKREELVGKSFLRLNILPKDQIPKAAAALARNIAGKPTGPDEFTLIRKDGSRVEAEISTYPVKIAGKRFVLGIARDITERKKAEEELKKSEEKYRNLVDNAIVGIYKTNMKGEILYANMALAKMFGFRSPREMMAQGVMARYKNPKDREVLIKALEREGKVNNFGVELLTKTGKVKSVILSATMIGDVISGMIMDITEKKKMENEIKKSEGRLRAIFNASDEIIFTKDVKKGRYTSANAAFSKKFKMPVKDIVGKTDKEIFPKNEAKMLQDIDKRVLKGETVKTEDELTVLGEKRIFKTTKVPLRDEKENVIGLCGFAEDITEKKRVEDELKKTKNFLETIVESTGSPIVGLDVEGKIKFVNRALEEITGYKRDEILGKRWFDIFLPESVRDDVVRVFKGLKEGKMEIAKQHENPILTKHGEKKTILWSNTVLKDERGRIEMVISIGNDVTEKKKYEEELKKRTEEAERFSKLSVGRELKMIELKKRIRELEEKLKEHGIKFE